MKKTREIFLAAAALMLCSAALLCASQKIVKVSGDDQLGIAGYPLKKDFVVQVTSDDGQPAAGVPVVFTIIEQPADASGKNAAESSLSSAVAITDTQGFACSRLNMGYPGSGQIITTVATPETVGNPVIFNATASSKHWLIFLILGVVGGLGIFLFGMFYLNDGLQKIAGHKLREVLIALTGSSWRGLSTGILVTAFNQSSSATTLLEVSLVSAGLLTFYQSMAITMGAELGSTITAQLIAFKLSDYAIFIAGLGFYISFIARNKIWKRTGDIILGFGILFLGIKIMSDLFIPLKNYGPFMEIMKHASNPFYGILAGLIFALIVHSSGATSGIIVALALAGGINLFQAVVINLGAQIGTCVTAVLGSIGRIREGKRVALWHVFHQTAGVLLVLPFLTLISYKGEPSWIYFVKWFTATFFGAQDLARQIAMSHTMVAMFNALLFLPFLPLMSKLLNSLLPSREQEKPFGPIYIDEGLLSAPSLAIEQARKEILREGDLVMEMMNESIKVFESQDLKLCETVSLKDIRVDVLHNSIVPYITKIGQGYLTDAQSRKETHLLYVTADLEAIGDIIDKNIMPLARKKISNKLWFSDEGWYDIVTMHSRVIENLKRALETLRDDDLEKAKLIAASKQEVDEYEYELRKRHIARLHSGLQEALETSSVHLDLIDQFKRINSHVAAIGDVLSGHTT